MADLVIHLSYHVVNEAIGEWCGDCCLPARWRITLVIVDDELRVWSRFEVEGCETDGCGPDDEMEIYS